MCGIVAVINKRRYGFNMEEMNVFSDLLYLDALRGEDSTGVFMVDNIGNVEIAKAAKDGHDFLKETAWSAIRGKSIARGWAMVGHNRKATRGKVIDENAHPFWVDEKLVLVHNGSMYGDHKKLANVEVDSHAIAHALAENPDTEAVLKGINAAYALVWYDIPNKKLQIIRNSQRPLGWAETEHCYFLASEPEMLDWVLPRRGLKILNKGDWAQYIKPEQMLTLALQSDKSFKISSEDMDVKYVYPVQQEPSKSPPAPFPVEKGQFVQGRWIPDVVADDGGCDADDCGGYLGGRFSDESGEIFKQIKNNLLRAIPPAEAESVRADEAVHKNITLGQNAKFTYREWASMRDTIYKSGTKVRVIMEDYVDEEAVGKSGNFIYMSGHLEDAPDIHASFPISRYLFDELTAPGGTTSPEVVFSVEVDKLTWRQNEKKIEGKIDDSIGVVFVRGINPQLIVN